MAYLPQAGRSRAADTFLTAMALVIWGSTYLVTTELLPPGRPFTAALVRSLPAGLLLTAYCRQLPRRIEAGRLFLLAALHIGFFQALLFVAAYRLPGGVAAVVGAIQPVLVMALAWSFDGMRPRLVTLAAAVLGIGGMAALLLAPGTSFDIIGVLAALAGAVCMATGTYLTRRWRPSLPLLALTGWQLLLGGLVLAPIAIFADPPLPVLTFPNLAGYAYLIVGAIVGYTLWFRGIDRLPAVNVSSLGLLSPLTAVFLGWAVLGQSVRDVALPGFGVVLVSILVVQRTG